jgi:hypothetical protein
MRALFELNDCHVACALKHVLDGLDMRLHMNNSWESGDDRHNMYDVSWAANNIRSSRISGSFIYVDGLRTVRDCRHICLSGSIINTQCVLSYSWRGGNNRPLTHVYWADPCSEFGMSPSRWLSHRSTFCFFRFEIIKLIPTV